MYSGLLMVAVVVFAAPKTQAQEVSLERQWEPRERAFSLLVPAQWTIQGGILRVDPTAAGGPAQSIEAKLDMKLVSDAQGTVMLYFVPHVYFVDTAGTNLAWLFPYGSNYMGMTVMPFVPPQDFATKVLFPYLHPQAANARLVGQMDLPELTARMQKDLDFFNANSQPWLNLQFRASAGIATMDYEEAGVSFRETMVVALEHRGPLANNQWCNRMTLVGRAPVAAFDGWNQVFTKIVNSIEVNPEWMRGEILGQEYRTGVMRLTQEQLQQLDAEITRSRRETNEAIMQGMQQVLTATQ